MDSSALLAASTSMANTAMNAASQERTNRWQLKLAQYAYDQERQMIQEQNEYNSPLNQMKRYIEAGLNPNLIYGEGKASAGNQSSIAQYHAPSLRTPEFNLDSAFGNYYQLLMAQKQAKLMDAEVANRYVQNGLLNQEYQKRNRENIINDLLMGVDPVSSTAYPNLDVDKVRGSKLFQQYDSAADEQIFRAKYMDASEQLRRLDVKEQQWVVDNYLQIEKEILNLRKEGLSYVAAIARVKADNIQQLKDMGINTEVVDMIFDAIGSLSDLFDSFSPVTEVFEKIPGGYKKTRSRK